MTLIKVSQSLMGRVLLRLWWKVAPRIKEGFLEEVVLRWCRTNLSCRMMWRHGIKGTIMGPCDQGKGGEWGLVALSGCQGLEEGEPCVLR